MTQSLDGATVLVCGGAGFIGSNFVLRLLEEGRGSDVVVLDLLTYAGNLENLDPVHRDPRYTFVRGDIADPAMVEPLVERADYVVNFAAETHVDRSIEDQSALIHTNVEGPLALLNACRKHPVKRFLQVGTDEVYGEVMGDPVDEEAPIKPRNPYSASKAGGDAMAMAYHATFDLPVVLTRCSNNYGPYQYPEKMIPLFTTNAMDGGRLPVYGSGKNQRDWIHVSDHVRALDAILAADAAAVDGEIFNIAGDNERNVLEIAAVILDTLGLGPEVIDHVTDRLGHDRRYALTAKKLQDRLGFEPGVDFSTGLPDTVRWYQKNRTWWERIKSGAFQDYYDRMYGDR